MKRAYLTFAMLALTADAADAADRSERLRNALAVEFMMARCDGDIPEMVVMTAGMVINGNEARVVERNREAFQKELQERFKSPGEACATLWASVKQ